MKKFYLFLLAAPLLACQPDVKTTSSATNASTTDASTAAQTPADGEPFQYEVDRFADMRVLRYPVPGFEQLDLRTKTLLYYLSQAGMSGRDITWDQNYRYNLKVRQLLEAIIRFTPQEQQSGKDFQALLLYAKQMWFASGIHHHYSNDKFTPEFDFDALTKLANNAQQQSGFPLSAETLKTRLTELRPIIFDPDVDRKKVNKANNIDKVTASAVNFYQGVTEQEVTDFYAQRQDNEDAEPISYGLNSQLVKRNGEIVERVWKIGGMYSPAIEKVVYWLEKAISVAEDEPQKQALELLVKYYKTGDLRTFDQYNIAWVQDTESQVDAINGFIEVYNDPLAYRGSFESVVSVRDPIATQRIAAIGSQAQWFEDHSPIDDAHKKNNVKGISARAINVVSETGDSSPVSPIGINLPNANWIRTNYGSKSVSLSNLVNTLDHVAGSANEEFSYSEEEKERARRYNDLASALKTDMHEVIGHASGKLNPGVGTPKQTLKQYGSTLEEARADLVALYYLPDPKLMEIGVMPNEEVAKAGYDYFIRNGLMLQLRRIKPGDEIEEDHMRNRQLIARWVYEQSRANDVGEESVIERKTKDGKTYFIINDYDKLRTLFGQLLREIQRIKSEGDFAAAQTLVETYGVKVDPDLHREVLARYEKLNIPPYSGFLNPRPVPVEKDGDIVDIKIEYPKTFVEQMLEYSQQYGFLPLEN